MLFFIIFFALCFLFYVPPLLYFKLGWFKFFYHNLLKWHTPDIEYEITQRDINTHARCKHCGKEIIQDSQGNWFEI